MRPPFNIDRPKVSDEEIKKHQDFAQLVEQFKQKSLKQARGDESWWKNKAVRYSTVIAGVTVVCTITWLTLFNTKKQNINDKINTQVTQNTGSKAKKKNITPPSSTLKINYASYKVNNQKGGELTHPSSSKIRIPKNSFADKNGKDIIGDVTIEYREFHDHGDVIAGGIPMQYDSAGTSRNFESAGMFDIRGTQNGDPVFIKDGKDLEVELASKTSEDRFNQYYFDTTSGNWYYLNRDNLKNIQGPKEKKAQTVGSIPDPALRSKMLKQEIESVIPNRIDSVKTVCNARIEKLPKPKEPARPAQATAGRPSFKLSGSNEEFPELAAFDKVVFEVGPENKNYSKELHEITWSDVKILPGPQKGKNYMLNLSYRGRVEKLVVYPVLQGEDYEKAKAQYEQKFDNYEKLLEKRKADEARIVAEMEAKQSAYLAEQKKKEVEYQQERARMSQYEAEQQNELASNFSAMNNENRAKRIFAVSKFGIYNSDCPHSIPNGVAVSPIFVLNDRDVPIRPDQVYVVDHTDKTVLNIDPRDGLRFSYDKGREYSICIFKGNKFFFCGKKKFKETSETEGNKFFVTAPPTEADNLADFKKFLEI